MNRRKSTPVGVEGDSLGVIYASVDGEGAFVEVERIAVVWAERKTVSLTVLDSEDKFHVRCGISWLHQALGSERFVRISRSTLVNRQSIRGIEFAKAGLPSLNVLGIDCPLFFTQGYVANLDNKSLQHPQRCVPHSPP